MRLLKFIAISLALFTIQLVQAGPIAYGICQAGCSALVVACYSAGGFQFGTVAAALAPPALLTCNKGFGICSAACATTALLAPVP